MSATSSRPIDIDQRVKELGLELPQRLAARVWHGELLA